MMTIQNKVGILPDHQKTLYAEAIKHAIKNDPYYDKLLKTYGGYIKGPFDKIPNPLGEVIDPSRVRPAIPRGGAGKMDKEESKKKGKPLKMTKA